MAIPIDNQCTLWVIGDEISFFGYSITPCCVEHDHGLNDFGFLQCMLEISPVVAPLAIVVYLGVKIGRPVTRVWFNKRNNKNE